MVGFPRVNLWPRDFRGTTDGARVHERVCHRGEKFGSEAHSWAAAQLAAAGGQGGLVEVCVNARLHGGGGLGGAF